MTINSYSIAVRRQMLEKARTRARELSQELSDALGKAASFADPNLSEAGLAAKRASLRQEFTAAARGDLEKARKEALEALDYLKATADEHRPRIAHDTADLMLTKQKWDQVQMRLEKGLPLRKAIANADLQTLLAIEEHAPSWLAAQSDRKPTFGEAFDDATRGADNTPDPLHGDLRTLQARLIELSPPDTAEALRAAYEADREVAIMTPWWDHVDSVTSGGSVSGLDAALASQIAESSIPSLTVAAPADAA